MRGAEEDGRRRGGKWRVKRGRRRAGEQRKEGGRRRRWGK